MSRSSSLPITAKPLKARCSIRLPPSINAMGSGGLPSRLMRTFLFKQSHQPRVWASMWASPILSQPRRENSTGVFLALLARRHKRDREKRRSKARLRACLQKKGVKKLLSTSSATGQRLGRHVRQEINRAVNLMLADHPNARIIYEDLSVASMRFKARSMNAYLYASNLAHIPDQIAWATARRGMAAHRSKPPALRRSAIVVTTPTEPIDQTSRRSTARSVGIGITPITTPLSMWRNALGIKNSQLVQTRVR